MMKLRHQYLAVGILWALLLAPLAALSATGFAAGASWLWLYGDNPWPAGTETVILLVGIAAGIAVAALCILFAWRYGIGREPNTQTDRTRLLIAGAAPVAIALLLGARIWIDGRSYSQAMARAAQREAEFVTLSADVQKIAGLNMPPEKNGAFAAGVHLAGKRKGSYRLKWQITSTSFSEPLITGNQHLDLYGGVSEKQIRFSLNELAEGYRKHLSKPGNVLVDEPFRLSVLLQPSLSEMEKKSLPPGEQYRLDTSDSPLLSEKSIDFPMRFSIHSDGTVTR